ncbi:hypothetical protein OG21DRAFT_1527068 [Imleria badia]|nr:hypothetical protein OG21DRAFT_1527068 [Imleria badia]
MALILGEGHLMGVANGSDSPGLPLLHTLTPSHGGLRPPQRPQPKVLQRAQVSTHRWSRDLGVTQARESPIAVRIPDLVKSPLPLAFGHEYLTTYGSGRAAWFLPPGALPIYTAFPSLFLVRMDEHQFRYLDRAHQNELVHSVNGAAETQSECLAFNWGALLGWSAVAGCANWRTNWDMLDAGLYAHQDKTDDVKAGICSTALLFGDHTRPILSVLSASSVALVTYTGILNHHGPPFYVGMCLSAAQLALVLRSTDFDSGESCWRGFIHRVGSGFWIWMGALVDHANMMYCAPDLITAERQAGEPSKAVTYLKGLGGKALKPHLQSTTCLKAIKFMIRKGEIE